MQFRKRTRVAVGSTSDVGGSPIVLTVVLGVGGLVAGLIAIRTRSVLVQIAWHVALDLRLYAYWACRAS